MNLVLGRPMIAREPWIEARTEEIRDTLLAALPHTHHHAELQNFYQHLKDYPLRGGKMLRGRLLLLSTEAHGANYLRGLPCAAALELFQNWVLVHDDIEDGSEERRGAPALHQKIGMPLAVNVGDALHVYMWQLLLDQPRPATPRLDAILDEFLTMIHRTAEGQHLDLTWIRDGCFDIGESEYLEMVTLKTAFYTVVSPLRLGAMCADSDVAAVFQSAGEALGVAFQIRDDVLNLTPAPRYGKEFAGDLYEGKRTAILAHFFATATAGERDEAISVLSKPRHQKTGADVEALLQLLAKCGSLQYAQRLAETHAQKGLASLRQGLEGLPDQIAARKLLGLLETLTSRSQ